MDQTILQKYKHKSPDYLNEGNSVTFVYSSDHNMIWYADYPMTHFDILNKNNQAVAMFLGHKPEVEPWDEQPPPAPTEPPESKIEGEQMFQKREDYHLYMRRDEAVHAGLLLGRTGDRDGHPAIAFWNNLKNVDENILVNCLRKTIAIDPNVNKEDTVVFCESSGVDDYPARFLSQIMEVQPSAPNNQQRQADSPECLQRAKIYVQGQEMNFSKILGDLHMVKGTGAEHVRSAFCAQTKELERNLQHCPGQLNLFNSIRTRMGCGNTKEYQNIHSGGKIARIQELQAIFADQEQMSHYNQRQINVMWDELMGLKGSGFREWLSYRERI